MARDTYRAAKARPAVNRLMIPTGEFFPDGFDPKAYCFHTVGTCMIPEVMDGDYIIASPAAPLVRGQKVSIFFRDGRQPLIKRLLEHPAFGDLHLTVAMLNPYRALSFQMAEIECVHMIVGVYTPEKHDEAVRMNTEAEERKAARTHFYVDRRGDCMPAAKNGAVQS
jgi:hypothetical protein